MVKRIPESPPHILPYLGEEQIIWSVMIPVYNCFKFIEETITSVLDQDLGENIMQIEVIDDYSTDGKVEELVKQLGNGRVQYFRQKQNVGSLRNFETCINRSKGKYVHILHGDDKLEPGFYNEIDFLFKNYPNAGAAFTNFHLINGNSKIAESKDEFILDAPGIIPNFLEKIASKQLLQPPAIVVKRSTYENLGGFFAVHFGEDWEMWTRISAHYPVAYSPKKLANYRVGHGDGISYNSFQSGQNFKDLLTVINIIQNYLPDNKRQHIKDAALKYNANYCIKIANSLILKNTKVAKTQIKGAWSMSKDFYTMYRIVRFYVMYFSRFKQIESFIFPESKSFKKFFFKR
ncbi:glycosyltransferase [Neotamlana nanhaiensis]|uniref:glycosyltransferase n=1 Tax=Neotamlana nanhaiensis TaxID=1382798 RepID=UPI0005CB8A73|nr:glycosyltransferase [Tamlana nanhaiensis]